MRIALVSPNYHPRTCGVGDYSMRVAQELMRRRIEVRVFTRAPAEPHPEAPEVPVASVRDRGPRQVAVDLARAVTAWAPREAWLQYTSQMFGASRLGSPAMAWLARRLRASGIRVQLVAHELFIPWSARPDLMLGAALQRAWLSALLSGSERAVVTTPSRLEAIRRFPRGREEGFARVVPVGANALPVERQTSGRFLLGTYSTLSAGKRFDVVLRAFASVAARLPDAGLVVIGDLGDARSARLRRFRRAVSRHPAASRIEMTGRLSLRGVSERVAALDVFLFPTDTGASTRSGTLPLALGTGVPVIAVGGIETSDLFRDGENMALAPGLTGDAFADAALRLHRDGEFARRVGEGGRTLYRERLAWPVIVDALLG